MFILASIAAIGTCPEPAVFAILDSRYEILAYFVGRSLGVAMLAHHDLP